MTSLAAAAEARLARALWYTAKGRVELLAEPLPAPRSGEVLVRALYTAISRGTERLIMSGAVPQAEWERMRAPLQVGSFPFPVKYGYCAAGVVEAGPEELVGRTVFALHPHQDYFVAPAHMVVPLPEGIPAKRATLAANMETALNALWDSGAGPADRIVVVGAGIVGMLVAFLAARLPGADVTILDVSDDRAELADKIGLRFTRPGGASADADIVFHTSATAAGLATAIDAAGLETTIVELSWYGDAPVPAPLGGAFHSKRLRLVSSQVGQVAPSRRPRWSHRRRLEAAISLLHDPRLDALVSQEIDFHDAPEHLPKVLAPGAPGLAPVIRYPAP